MDNREGPKEIVLLGSTGSVGCSALEVIRHHPDLYRVVALVAGSNKSLLVQQILEFRPDYAHLASGSLSKGEVPSHTTMLYETNAPEVLATLPEADLILAAMVGIRGLPPVYAALKAEKTVLLANKESLVCAGELLTGLQSGTLLPVDSEHSALFQLSEGQSARDIDSLILTASGGPFLGRSRSELSEITPEEARKHPRWSMGPKISVDSATMMNKALELIEAHWLFQLPENRIRILVHPESIVHSLVEFTDGVLFAHLSTPDMRAPIAYALSYPNHRISSGMKRLDLAALQKLTFSTLDEERFPAVPLARAALRRGGAMPAVFNCANEVAVKRFFEREMAFLEIEPFVEGALTRYDGLQYSSIEDLLHLSDEIESIR